MFDFIKKLFNSRKPQKKKNSFLDGTHTIGEMQNKPLEDWGDNDIFEGVIFSATLQIRTPLEVLEHHGEIFKEKNQIPPNYAKEQWHGIWLVKLQSKYKIIKDSTCSSDIGQVNATEYLPFLIEFRKIVESTKTINEMIRELYDLADKNKNFKAFWNRHSKMDADFPNSFFYNQLTHIDGVGVKSAKLLYENGFKNIKDLQNAKDEDLLKIKGIGKSLLEKIRKSLTIMK